MITYTSFNSDGNPIDENGDIIPIVEGRPRLFNGTAIIEFESHHEFNQYFGDDSGVWDKYSYAYDVNAKHNELFKQIYESRNYLSIGEINTWVGDSEFGAEALALIDWWRDTCKLVEEYLHDVSEETVIDNFVDTLPPFEL